MHPLQNKIIKGVNHGHIIIPLSMRHFFFKYRNRSVQEMIHLLKFVSTSLKTLGAVQWILLTILLCLKNQYDDNTEICYMQHFGPDLTFTQVNRCSAFDFDGSGATAPLPPLLSLRRSLQQHCQLRKARAISKYFLMPKANQEMTFSTSRELLIGCYWIFHQL